MTGRGRARGRARGRNPNLNANQNASGGPRPGGDAPPMDVGFSYLHVF